MVTSPKIVINLPMTYEKLHRKKNHFSSADPSVKTDIQIDRPPVAFIMDCFIERRKQ